MRDDEMVSREAALQIMNRVEHDVSEGMMLIFREILNRIDTPRPVKIEYNPDARIMKFQIGSDEPEFIKLTLEIFDPSMN